MEDGRLADRIGAIRVIRGPEVPWLRPEAALGSVTATGNGGSGMNIDITGTLKLSAITSENNGAGDVLP